MKYVYKQLRFFAVYLITGALLVAAALMWSPDGQRESTVSGIICGFSLTGVGGLILCAYLIKHPKKADEAEIAKTEERTEFLRLKTQSAAHSATIMLICLGTFAAMISGHRDITLTLAAVLITDIILSICFSAYYSQKY